MYYLLIFLVGGGSGIFCTWLIREWARRKNIVNNPNPLIPQHTHPVAYLGGVGIYIGLMLAIIIYYILFDFEKDSQNIPILFLILGASSYLILGVLDDLYTFSARKKLIWQFLLAIASVSLGVRFNLLNFSLPQSILTVLWIVVIVNAVNLTDVCDGLVAGLCVLTFGILSLFSHTYFLFNMTVGAVTTGFLFFNFPKASIFLGDAGTHLLGFLLAAICILSVPDRPSIVLKVSWMLLVPGVMLFELLFLIIVRFRKRIPWWKGSPDHFSLRLQSAGFNRIQTDIIAWGINIVFVLTACIMPFFIEIIQYITLFCIMSILFWAGRYLLRHEVE